MEYLVGSPYTDGIVTVPWQLDQQGMLAIPDSPGLGLRLDLDAVERLSGRRLLDQGR